MHFALTLVGLIAGVALAAPNAGSSRAIVGTGLNGTEKNAVLDNFPHLPDDATYPTGIRISQKGPTVVSVGWTTYKKLAKPTVYYGTDKNNLDKTAYGPASVTSQTARTWLNHVDLTGVPAGSTVFYKVHSNVDTDVKSVKSLLPAGDKTPFSFVTYGDLGLAGKYGYIPEIYNGLFTPIEDRSHKTVNVLADKLDEYDFVLHVGDYAYADDWFLNIYNILGEDIVKDSSYQAVLEWFFQQLEVVTAKKPYFMAVGNHEAACNEAIGKICPPDQQNFTDVRLRFSQTQPSGFATVSDDATAKANNQKATSLAVPPFWYSYDAGSVHFVVFNTETDFPNAAEEDDGSVVGIVGGPFGRKNQQLEWIEADLASVDRSVTPWIIVGGHRPYYTGGVGSADDAVQKAFEHIFYKYGVDLAIFGHEHNFQSYKPLYKNKVDAAEFNNPKAPWYLVVGGAGNSEFHSPSSPSTIPGQVFGNWFDYSIAKVDIVSDTQLRVSFIESATEKVVYSQELYKAHSERFVRQ